jgi:L-seryl-tRNA(Ser) seleniumtransferase
MVLTEAGKSLDLFSFSGDKLFGGPQAGIILGRKDLIEALSMNPLTRVLRPDKFTLAALEATLLLYLDPLVACREIPVLRMLSSREEPLRKRANRLKSRLVREGLKADIQVVRLLSEVGGGSCPDTYIPSCGLSLRPHGVSVAALDRRLRSLETPIVGRIEKDTFLMDMRTVQERDEQDLVRGLKTVLIDGR